MEREVQHVELVADRDDTGALHWRPGFESSPILAVAGVPLRGGVAAKEAIVDAAACLGWRLQDSCEDRHHRCSLRLTRPAIIDLR